MGRTLLGIVLVLVAFSGLCTFGWYVTKDRIRSQKQYCLSADEIDVSPAPPDCVPDRFVEDVLLRSGLNKTVSILDSALSQKLTEAFIAHPWVAKVVKVVPRYPSGAEVQVVYREPAALVEQPQQKFLPVDTTGVLLPTEYVTETISDRRDEHLIIQGIQSAPLGAAGMPWGDSRVKAAAQLAAQLEDIADEIQLKWLLPESEITSQGEKMTCRLKTAFGTEILWGEWIAGDLKNEEKKKKLWSLHDQFGSLNNVPPQMRPIRLDTE